MRKLAGLLLSLVAVLAAQWYIRQPSKGSSSIEGYTGVGNWFTLHNDGGGV